MKQGLYKWFDKEQNEYFGPKVILIKQRLIYYKLRLYRINHNIP